MAWAIFMCAVATARCHREYQLGLTKTSLPLAMALWCCAADPLAASSIINIGTQAWVQAAYTGRADMLILGDSITNHIGTGWTGGISYALSQQVGLAGGGMMGWAKPAVYPGRAGTQALLGPEWIQPTAVLPMELQQYALGADVLLADNTQPTTLEAVLGRDADILDREDGYVWKFWVAGTGETDGTIQASRTVWTDQPRVTELLHTSATYSVPESADEPFLIEIPFAPTPGQPGDRHEFALQNTTDTALFYHRLINPQATGATVTGWGYSGGSTHDFVTDLYNNGRLTEEGRATYLSNLVHGNSGKLNVVIAEGVNDSRETAPSLTEWIEPGSSKEAFIDNIKTLVNLVSDDWEHAGLDPNDLSFTLLSTYQLPEGLISDDKRDRLPEYRDALRELAQTSSRYSFIDMWDAGPSADEIQDSNYLINGVHPSVEGARVFGNVFVEELFGFVPGDIDHDLNVGISDLNALLTNWNRDAGPRQPLMADIDLDGFVGLADLSAVLSEWNRSINTNPLIGDIDGDDVVGINDLTIVLENWNQAVTPGDLSRGDVIGDGLVGLEDLSAVLANWNRSKQDNILTGDLNGDGKVGIEDLGLTLSQWNQRETLNSPIQVDLNGDGFIGIEDLMMTLNHWNTSAETALGSTGSVPEPGCAWLITCGAMALIRRH
jgi:hypothetical protein